MLASLLTAVCIFSAQLCQAASAGPVTFTPMPPLHYGFTDTRTPGAPITLNQALPDDQLVATLVHELTHRVDALSGRSDRGSRDYCYWTESNALAAEGRFWRQRYGAAATVPRRNRLDLDLAAMARGATDAYQWPFFRLQCDPRPAGPAGS